VFRGPRFITTSTTASPAVDAANTAVKMTQMDCSIAIPPPALSYAGSRAVVPRFPKFVLSAPERLGPYSCHRRMAKMYAGKVEICGVNTAQLPVLSEKQKTALLAAAHAGDADARQQMIQGNLRLVLSVVQKFAGRGENLDDLFQVGCIGLIKAIDHFDPTLKVRFSTYGVPMIVGEIRRFLRDNAPMRVSRSIRELAYHSMQAREELQKQTGRKPRVSEIAARLGATPENVAMALESVVEPVSLYEPAYTDGDESVALMDRVPEA